VHAERSDVPYTNDGINHLGFVVDDMDGLVSRMSEAGYHPTAASAIEGHPYRKRAYFLDKNDFEWEFVEYLVATRRKKIHIDCDSGRPTAPDTMLRFASSLLDFFVGFPRALKL